MCPSHRWIVVDRRPLSLSASIGIALSTTGRYRPRNFFVKQTWPCIGPKLLEKHRQRSSRRVCNRRSITEWSWKATSALRSKRTSSSFSTSQRWCSVPGKSSALRHSDDGFISVGCLLALLAPGSQARRETHVGTEVQLGVICSGGDNARQLLVCYLAHGKIWLNDYPLDEAGLRAKI
jgi:hypothetical protein